jgi:dihydroorotase
MNVLLQQVTIICSTSAYHEQVKDILIEDGVIKKIANTIPSENYEVIKGNNLHVSIGWMDIFADFAEPGNEHRETLESGANAAAAGGFTDVMLIPNTNPVVDSKAQVEFLIERSKQLLINIYPIGAVTKNAEGNTLAEMYDMHASAAVAFSDGTRSIQQSGILLKALQYVAAKNATIMQVADDKSISDGGLMNEGIESTKLGLPGKPAIAEELMIASNIELLDYTNSKLHITGVSTKKGIELIAAAKKKGLQITYSVTPYHLYFCDEDLSGYDTNLKVNPPLRTRADMHALQAALRAGEIDCIASHHSPQSWDDKTCEFEYAKNGMITLQTLYGTVNNILNDTEALIKMLTENNRNIFDIARPVIEENSKACLTIFEPNTEFFFEEDMIVSKSKNSAFVGKIMKGKVLGIINKGKMVLNNFTQRN